MSILERHPAPWQFRDGEVVDANGYSIVTGGCVGLDNADACIDGDCLPLLLAAPELLAALKRNVDAWLEEGYFVEVACKADCELIQRLDPTWTPPRRGTKP